MPSRTQCRTPKVVVLRWGHRPHRDARLTAHIALAARALGAGGLILTDIEDSAIEETVGKVTKSWGGQFSLEMGTSWKKAIRDWKAKGGITVHLTAYGENIQKSDVLPRIRRMRKPVLIIIGCQKVPGEFYSQELSDFNVAIGNQPHSECASLAIFLDRLFEGKELERSLEGARMRIIPRKRGKKIVRDERFRL